MSKGDTSVILVIYSVIYIPAYWIILRNFVSLQYATKENGKELSSAAATATVVAIMIAIKTSAINFFIKCTSLDYSFDHFHCDISFLVVYYS